MPTSLKLVAIKLRKRGYSHSEISEKTGVPQPTLSGWLKGIELTKKQKLRLEKKSAESRKLGSQTLLNNRIAKTFSIIEGACSEVKKLTKKDLWLVGTILYWAEGSKQKDHNPSKEVTFSNSDPAMIKMFLRWLRECLEIPEERIVFEIYIHKTYRKSLEELERYWSDITGFAIDKFPKVYFKKNKVHSFRRNRGAEYNGVLRVSVRRSTDLNRRITGWIKGVCNVLLIDG